MEGYYRRKNVTNLFTIYKDIKRRKETLVIKNLKLTFQVCYKIVTTKLIF